MPKGHYTRQRKSVLERILEQIEVQSNGCWWWTGLLSDQGYARIRIQRVTYKVHRVFYGLQNGVIPEGHDLDHTCHDPLTCYGGPSCLHRRCINSDHFTPVTPAINRSKNRSVGNRGYNAGSASFWRNRTHCKHGHEYTESNTVMVHNGKTMVRACMTCRQSRWCKYT